MAGLSSSNPVFGRTPALQPQAWGPPQGVGAPGYPTPGQVEEIWRTPQRLTIDDVVVKTGLLLAVMVVAGAFSWISGSPVLLGVGLVGGLVLGLVNSFKREVSVPLVLAYAVCEGLLLGGLSAIFENTAGFEGIALQAAVGTSVVFATVLVLYKNKVLRVTPRFTKMVTGALIGLLGLMLLNGLINIFDGAGSGLSLRNGSGIAIVFSLVCIGVAAMTLVLDFDQAERMVAAGAPEKESWRLAFGLVVSLVWIYVEMLRLLSYLRDE